MREYYLTNFAENVGVTSDYEGDDLDQEIINERRREFCYQTDMRWLDMKRYGIGTNQE